MASTNVTKEVVELTAIDNASRVIQGVGSAATKLGGVYDGLIAKMGALGFAVAGLGGVAGFAAMIKGSIEAEAGLLRLSEKTGNTVEALSSLMRVAKMSNTDMDEVGKGMQKLAKAMAEAESGTGKAGKVFEALGISIRDVSTGQLKPTQVVMQELGQKLMAMRDQTLAVAFAQETMGKAGANLLPFLYELARAGELHVKVTTEQAKQAKEFEDNLVKLKSASTDFWRHLANDMLPTLNKYLDQLIAGKQIFGSWWEAMKGAGLTNPFQSVEGQQASARANVQRLSAYQQSGPGNPGFDADVTARELAAAQKQLDWFNFMQRQQIAEKFRGQDLGDQNSRKGQTPVAIANPFAAGNGGADGPDFSHQIAVWEMAVKASKELAASESEREAIEKAAAIAADKLNRAYDDQAETLRKLIDPTRAFHEAMAAVEELLQKGKITQDEASQALTHYQEAIDKVLAKDLPKDVKENDELVKRLGLTFTSAFESAATGGKKLSEVFKSLLLDIEKVFFRLTVTEPLAKEMEGLLKGSGITGGGGLGGLFSGFFNRGSSSDAAGREAGTAMVGDGFGGLVPALASGTDFVPRDMLAVIHRGEAVIPASENRGGSAGATFNIDARGASLEAMQELRRMVNHLNGSIEGRAVAAVANDNLRGKRY